MQSARVDCSARLTNCCYLSFEHMEAVYERAARVTRIFAAALALLSTPAVWAVQPQSEVGVGSLIGMVADRDGGTIPGASIVVRVGSDEKKAVSNSVGQFRIDALPVGVHRVRASLAGFVPRTSEVRILPNRETTWNATLAVRTAHSREPVSGPDPTDPKLSAGVYEAILRRIPSHVGKPTIVVTSLIQPFDDDEDWPSKLSVVPPAVRRASMDARRPVKLRSESFAADARLVEKPTAADIPYAGFSRVFFSGDTLGALVVAELICGNVCGQGELIWLRRDSTSASWIIDLTYMFWVS